MTEFWGDAAMDEFSRTFFRNAWTHAMQSTVLREWLFNRESPTVRELIQCLASPPLMHLLSLSEEDGGPFDAKSANYNGELTMVKGQCHFLPCGSSLGMLFSRRNIDQYAPALAHFDAAFSDGSTIVHRNVLSTYKGNVFILEFGWLASGALTVRFVPVFVSKPTVSKQLTWNNPHALTLVLAFVPEDAQLLREASRTKGLDFVYADFEAMGISNRCYRIYQFDTASQSACVFCMTRGATSCACPAPIRRRIVPKINTLTTLSVQNACPARTIWNYYVSNVLSAEKTGSHVFNIRKGCQNNRQDSGIIVSTGILPYHCTVMSNGRAHATLLKKLDDIGRYPSVPHYFPSNATLLAAEHSRENLMYSNIFDDDDIQRHKPEAYLISWTQKTVSSGSAVPVPADETTKRNERAMREAPVKMFKCDICNVVIRNKKSNLNRHKLNKHSKKQGFRCHAPGCGMHFKTRLELTRHQRSTHSRGTSLSNRNFAMEPT